jgi:hypothetical protein
MAKLGSAVYYVTRPETAEKQKITSGPLCPIQQRNSESFSQVSRKNKTGYVRRSFIMRNKRRDLTVNEIEGNITGFLMS